ncbi:MAG: glycosyltransferase [Lutibacter sp.]|uniref:glycosyltransferase n=1 Tax=Lutibacter sp. TaxID=1925666 RepID=UPI0019F3B34E|nr:glycosyltransferase [Lutibacter sp.]NOR29097.1 glycosyltransferase [Lutibacter sp.]
MTKLFDLCIVIPCYNEEKRFDRERMCNFLKLQQNVLLCFVNDGSSDRTFEILNSLKSTYPKNIEAISIKNNVGKAEAVRTGILHCNKHFKHEKIAYLDADLATTLEECYEISQLVKDEIVFAFGSRIEKIDNNIDRKIHRFYIGRIIAAFISKQLKLNVYDSQCGCKIINSKLSEELFSEKFISKWLFDVEIFHRMIKIYGRHKIPKICKEIPLKSWIDYDESKVKMTYFFKLWLDLYKIKKAYS